MDLYQAKSYHIPAEQIETELSDIETNLAQLEKEGVELEKRLRSCEEGTFYLIHFFFPVNSKFSPTSSLFFFWFTHTQIKRNVDKSETSFSIWKNKQSFKPPTYSAAEDDVSGRFCSLAADNLAANF